MDLIQRIRSEKENVSPSFVGGLTMEAVSFSSGVPNRYEVLGLPDGRRAEIVCKIFRSIDIWKIRHNCRGRHTGGYGSAEEALAALQNGTAAPTGSE